MEEESPKDVTLPIMYEYADFYSQKVSVRVNREVTSTPIRLGKQCAWGTYGDIERNLERHRDRYASDVELLAFKSVVPELQSLYIYHRSLAGLGKTEVFSLRFDHLLKMNYLQV